MTLTDTQLTGLISLAQEASEAIMDIYNSNSTQVEYKADNSPLTQADKASHEILAEGMTVLFPDIPVLSEEGNPSENAAILQQDRFWLIDPIDGTQDFVNRSGEFCIAIGLIENNLPVFGLVVAPTFYTSYYGGPDIGSFKKVGTDPAIAIHVKELEPHVVAISRSHISETTAAYIDQTRPGAERRKLGSMLKQMKIAEGEVDFYPVIGQPLHLWDAAAGHAIIKGAGGYMTHPDGTELDYTNVSLKIGDFVARPTIEL